MSQMILISLFLIINVVEFVHRMYGLPLLAAHTIGARVPLLIFGKRDTRNVKFKYTESIRSANDR
jgi:hypothetical protein